MLFTFNKILKSKIFISNILKKNINFNNYKFIYKIKFNICILNFTLIALYLYKLYLYIYNISKNNQKILFVNNSYNLINYFIIKTCKLIGYFYIINWIPGLLTNWILLRKKIILYMWLDKILKNKYLSNILSVQCINMLKYIYIKIFNKFIGIKYMVNLPRYIFLSKFNDNLIIKEILKLKLILISFINLSLDSSLINIKILGNYTNYNSLKLLFKLIYTSIIHSRIKNI